MLAALETTSPSATREKPSIALICIGFGILVPPFFIEFKPGVSDPYLVQHLKTESGQSKTATGGGCKKYFFEDYSQHVANHGHDPEMMVIMSLVMAMILRW